MKLKAPRLHIAEGAAIRVLRELELEELPIDPMAIAARKEILVQEAPPSLTGFSGMLAQWDTVFGIMYSTAIDNPGFQRFSIAHELGHYFLPGHVEQLLALGPHRSFAGFSSRDPYEQEADFFAAALLMPAQLIGAVLRRSDEGLASVRAIGGASGTSLTASAVRYARVTRESVAVIFSEGQAVRFCLLSDAMKSAKVGWLRPGSPLPRGSATALFNSNPHNIEGAKQHFAETLLSDWFGGGASHTATEEIVGLGRHGRTLTVLYSEKLSAVSEGLEDDLEEDDQDLIERWTPRFRR